MSTSTAARPLRVALRNVGCKLNHYEIEALGHRFDQHDCKIVDFNAEADVYVVNTCTVTNAADADSRKTVRRAHRANPQALVVATGCYAQRRPNELKTAGADLIIDNAGKASLVEHVEAYLEQRAVPPVSTVRPRTQEFLHIDGVVAKGRTRGSLQIQDGCDEHCTYCVIPAVRGPGVSRPVKEIVEQARAMIHAGYLEIALTGVHTASYGTENDNPHTLLQVLEQLTRIEGLERLRLNSLEPGYVTNALIDFAAASPKICRHFHLPLQSGDDAILKRMGRHYTRRDYANRVERIATTIPDCAIGADVMAGFPGETDTNFGNTCEFIKALPLTYLHVFPFSQRPGTASANLPDHLRKETKQQRTRRLLEIGRGKQHQFHQRFVDQRMDILVEDRYDKASGLAVGLTSNYIKTLFPANGTPGNRIISVHIRKAREDVVFADL